MTIYYDISAAVHKHPGLGRYAQSLAASMAPAHDDDLCLVYYADQDLSIPASLSDVSQVRIKAGRKGWRMRVWAGQVLRRSFAHFVPDARLYHATEHLLMPLPGIPTVLTVHDLLFRLYPRYHKVQNYVYLNVAMPLFCRRADAIIAVSQSTKRDLVAYYGIAPEKITVVYEAAAPHFRPQPAEAAAAVCARHQLPERYVMTLCAIEPRKNHLGFLRAFERLQRRDPSLYWAIGGGKGWLYEEFFAALERSPARDRVILLGYVEEVDLAALYGGALAFVLPSFGEGFGLGLLEAMACGTPVLSSDATSLPEVGGDAARYFDPHDIESMVEATAAVVADEALRAEMRRLGLAQAAQFSWERAADETWAVYEGLLRAR